MAPGAVPGVAGVEAEALAGIARGAAAGTAAIGAGIVAVDAAKAPCAGGDPADAVDAGEKGVTLG